VDLTIRDGVALVALRVIQRVLALMQLQCIVNKRGSVNYHLSLFLHIAIDSLSLPSNERQSEPV
jgi:hypothetical protein